MDGSVDGAARPHTLPIAVPTGYDQIDGHSERVGYRSWVLCLSRLVLQRGTIPLRPEPFTWTGSQLTDPQTWPRAPRHSAGPGLGTGASAHTTASSSDLRRRSALSSTRVRSGDTFTDPSGRRIHPWRLMSFAQEVSATAVPPGRCRLSVASFYRRRYIFTQCATPKGRGKVPGKGSTSAIAISSEELLGPLNEIERKYAPPSLFVAGRFEFPLPHPRVAIVGTRTPSDEGRRIASKLAGRLARQGVIIVSGLARGIDTVAHKAAIDADGMTIAVLGTPISQTYPPENAELQSIIMRSHLAVTQFDDRHPTSPKNFVLRNRTMALIADASVIVESGEGGGSLHQGWEALRLGRPLFIHTHEFAKPRLAWPREMADYGAVEFKEPSDILDFLPSARLSLAVAAFDQT